MVSMQVGVANERTFRAKPIAPPQVRHFVGPQRLLGPHPRLLHKRVCTTPSHPPYNRHGPCLFLVIDGQQTSRCTSLRVFSTRPDTQSRERSLPPTPRDSPLLSIGTTSSLPPSLSVNREHHHSHYLFIRTSSDRPHCTHSIFGPDSIATPSSLGLCP